MSWAHMQYHIHHHGSLEPGIWLGDADDDWFNCSNWDNYQVPDASIDVIISSTAINDCYIDDAKPICFLL